MRFMRQLAANSVHYAVSADTSQCCLKKAWFSPHNFAAVLQLRSLLRRENYAMISLHTSLAAFFARLAVQLLPKRQRPW